VTVPGLVAVGVSHRTVPLELLERFALDASGAAALLKSLRSTGAAREAAVLSTCNRTEVYVVAADSAGAERAARAALPSHTGVRSFRDTDAVHHLFRVTAGLESMAVGETEIQGQVKGAYELALRERATGPVLNRLFRGALEAGKRARSGSRRAAPSLASLGVELAARRLGGLEGARAVVVGAGQNAEAAGRALARQGLRPVFVAARRYGRAVGLARTFGGRAVRLAGLEAELAEADLVFTCTASRDPVITRDQLAHLMQARPARVLVMVDSAVPRDVDPAVRALPRVELYDIDDLSRDIVSAPPQEASEALIAREVARFRDWLMSLDVVEAIAALRAAGGAAAEAALAASDIDWATLSVADRERVALVARTVAARLLHAPTMALREAAGTEAAPHYVRVVHGLVAAIETDEPADQTASLPA
jgi:glutamyl-tRNA reductase